MQALWLPFSSGLAKCLNNSINKPHQCYQSLLKISSGIETQKRFKKTRHSQPPFWQPQKLKLVVPENYTKQNEEFLGEYITDHRKSPLNVEQFEREEWSTKSFRCGLIGRKLGVHPMWLENGVKILPTLVQIIDNIVIKYIPPEELALHDIHYQRRNPRKNMGALVVGSEDADPRLFTKQYLSLFEETGIWPKRKLSKFYITPNAKINPGTPLFASHFAAGARVDVQGVSLFRGFQGVMKRWGFKGLRKTHGVTKSHRRGGNIGGKHDGVWKGTKMPGHMGREKITLRGIEVVRINTKYNVLYLRSPVPGPVNGYVNIYDSLLPSYFQTEENHQPFPTFFQEEESIEEELYAKKVFKFGSPPIRFQ